MQASILPPVGLFTMSYFCVAFQYSFSQGEDHIGWDFDHADSVGEAIALCGALSTCSAVNSWGYYKFNVDSTNIQPVSYFNGPCDGIFIKGGSLSPIAMYMHAALSMC